MKTKTMELIKLDRKREREREREREYFAAGLSSF